MLMESEQLRNCIEIGVEERKWSKWSGQLREKGRD
jgi:hypothetical protein